MSSGTAHQTRESTPHPVVRSTIIFLPRALVKRTVDITLAGLALLSLLPVFLILIRLIRRDGGAAFYAQRRVGLNGREFRCFKFRTMVPNAEAALPAILERNPALKAEYEMFWKLADDPRITPVGRFLRASSLDELPQLINVLSGEMSLVGPRPRSVSEAEYMRERFPLANAYLRVKPGLTGPWQVSGRNALNLEQKAALDASYASVWTLRGDVMLMLKTCNVVLSRRGAG